MQQVDPYQLRHRIVLARELPHSPDNICRSQARTGDDEGMGCAFLLRRLAQTVWLVCEIFNETGEIGQCPRFLPRACVSDGVGCKKRISDWSLHRAK
jgi:hypothetical protein